MSYRCGNPAELAGQGREHEVLKEYALLIARDARNQERISRVDPILAAYADEDYAGLRTAIVDYMCEYGDARAAVASARRAPEFPEPGSEAIPFDLPLLSMRKGTGTPFVSATDRFSLRESRGRIVVLTFWATWCRPCIEKHPELVRLAERYRDQGVVVYGIIYKDSPQNVVRWVEENGGSAGYPMLVDEGNKVGRQYRVTGVPRTFIIDRDGRIAQGTWGHFADLEEKLLHLVRTPAQSARLN